MFFILKLTHFIDVIKDNTENDIKFIKEFIFFTIDFFYKFCMTYCNVVDEY